MPDGLNRTLKTLSESPWLNTTEEAKYMWIKEVRHLQNNKMLHFQIDSNT